MVERAIDVIAALTGTAANWGGTALEVLDGLL